MPRLFALLLLVSALGCRTPPFDTDGGLVTVEDMAASGGTHDLRASHDLRATPTSCCGAAGNPGTAV